MISPYRQKGMAGPSFVKGVITRRRTRQHQHTNSPLYPGAPEGMPSKSYPHVKICGAALHQGVEPHVWRS